MSSDTLREFYQLPFGESVLLDDDIWYLGAGGNGITIARADGVKILHGCSSAADALAHVNAIRDYLAVRFDWEYIIAGGENGYVSIKNIRHVYRTGAMVTISGRYGHDINDTFFSEEDAEAAYREILSNLRKSTAVSTVFGLDDFTDVDAYVKDMADDDELMYISGETLADIAGEIVDVANQRDVGTGLLNEILRDQKVTTAVFVHLHEEYWKKNKREEKNNARILHLFGLYRRLMSGRPIPPKLYNFVVRDILGVVKPD